MEFKRILFKLSGESLKNEKQNICDFDYMLDVCSKIGNISKLGYDIGIVVGGGNIWRGRDNAYIDPTMSDQIGILSTTINSIILNAIFKELGFASKVFNSSKIDNIVDKCSVEDIEKELKNKKILIFGGGTGVVGCSTDTAASQRAIDMKSDIIIKLTNVDGVYDSDPKVNKNAKLYKKLTYDEVIDKDLNVMDKGSIIMCKENKIPIIVMNINKLSSIDKIFNLEEGTIVG